MYLIMYFHTIPINKCRQKKQKSIMPSSAKLPNFSESRINIFINIIIWSLGLMFTILLSIFLISYSPQPPTISDGLHIEIILIERLTKNLISVPHMSLELVL